MLEAEVSLRSLQRHEMMALRSLHSPTRQASAARLFVAAPAHQQLSLWLPVWSRPPFIISRAPPHGIADLLQAILRYRAMLHPILHTLPFMPCCAGYRRCDTVWDVSYTSRFCSACLQIKFIMEALLVLMDVKAGDAWGMVKRLMHDASRFISMLLSFDKDGLSSQ